MIFGRPKYESFQDTNPYKHLLIRFILNSMDNHDISPLTAIAPDALALLGLDVVYDPANFPKIREELDSIRNSIPTEGAPCAIPLNEPVFLLRAMDPLAASAAKHWLDISTKHGLSANRALSASTQIAAMEKYHQEVQSSGL